MEAHRGHRKGVVGEGGQQFSASYVPDARGAIGTTGGQ